MDGCSIGDSVDNLSHAKTSQDLTLRKKCPFRSYSGQHSVRMRENVDQDNPEHRHFSRSVSDQNFFRRNFV